MPLRLSGVKYKFRYWLIYLPSVSVKFSSVIHLTVDNYYLRDFGFISISV